MKKTFIIFSVPVAVLSLASFIFLPAYFASAQEAGGTTRFRDGSCGHEMGDEQSFHMGEVVEVDTQANTIVLKSLFRNQDETEAIYILVRYNDETLIKEDRDEVNELSISIGDKIRAHGILTKDSDSYDAEISADRIHLFDEIAPRRMEFGRHHERLQTENI